MFCCRAHQRECEVTFWKRSIIAGQQFRGLDAILQVSVSAASNKEWCWRGMPGGSSPLNFVSRFVTFYSIFAIFNCPHDCEGDEHGQRCIFELVVWMVPVDPSRRRPVMFVGPFFQPFIDLAKVHAVPRTSFPPSLTQIGSE